MQVVCEETQAEASLTCRNAPGRIRTMAPDIAFEAGRLADDATWTVPPAVATCHACKRYTGSVRRYRAGTAVTGPREAHWVMCCTDMCGRMASSSVRQETPSACLGCDSAVQRQPVAQRRQLQRPQRRGLCCKHRRGACPRRQRMHITLKQQEPAIW